jgi:hypothetical protein
MLRPTLCLFVVVVVGACASRSDPANADASMWRASAPAVVDAGPLQLEGFLPAPPTRCASGVALDAWTTAALRQAELLDARFVGADACASVDTFARELIEAIALPPESFTSDVLACRLAGTRDGTFAAAHAALAKCDVECAAQAGELAAVLFCGARTEAPRPLTACVDSDADAARCRTALVAGAAAGCAGRRVPTAYAEGACTKEDPIDGEGEGDGE